MVFCASPAYGSCNRLSDTQTPCINEMVFVLLFILLAGQSFHPRSKSRGIIAVIHTLLRHTLHREGRH